MSVPAAPSSVTISTGARLHFGPLAVGNVEGRRFGGVGLMIAEPGFELILRRGADDFINREHAAVDVYWREGSQNSTDDSAVIERIRCIVDDSLSAFLNDNRPLSIEVTRSLPGHQGLGSGTQLGLAVLSGLAALAGVDMEISQLAQLARRGERSAIGIHGFAAGGFLVDAGKRSPHEIGEIACRLDFPEEWPIILWTPPGEGISGSAERKAFEMLPPMSGETTSKLTDLAMRVLPAAVEHRDYPQFAHAVWEFGCRVGDYFAPAQGGMFACPESLAVSTRIRNAGALAVGQSSWGPTLFAIAPDLDTAQVIVRDPLLNRGNPRITSALNTGASQVVVQS